MEKALQRFSQQLDWHGQVFAWILVAQVILILLSVLGIAMVIYVTRDTQKSVRENERSLRHVDDELEKIHEGFARLGYYLFTKFDPAETR